MTTDTVAAVAPLGLSPRTRLWRGFWMVAAILATAWIVISLVRPAASRAAPQSEPRTHAPLVEPVQIVDAQRIRIVDGAPIHKQLTLAKVTRTRIKTPLLTVSGFIIARVVPGAEPIEDRWQFNNLELSTAYGEWLKSKSEIGFAQSQLAKTKELYDAETTYLEENLKRLTPLYQSSSIPEKTYREAKAELIKAQIQGEKSIFDAQSHLRVVQNNKVNLERTLSQDGVEPVAFTRASENMVLVTANVPESRIALVHEHQSCEVRFYGYFDTVYPAHVEALSASVTSERRILRVLFDVTDDKELLRPGMFAEVGLGTDERDAILIPADALLHVGQKDYVLVDDENDTWRVVAVTVGEPHGGVFEVVSGLEKSDRQKNVIAAGAILLKPTIAQMLAPGAGK